jgi:hypothetical protein
LLELAGIDAPTRLSSEAVSLLAPQAQRKRLAECPAPASDRFEIVAKVTPEFDPTPWNRSLRAYYDGRLKLIWGSDGRHELYDVASDPTESRDLTGEQSMLASRLTSELEAWVQTLERAVASQPIPELSPEQMQRLKALGYTGTPANDVESENGEKPDETP